MCELIAGTNPLAQARRTCLEGDCAGASLRDLCALRISLISLRRFGGAGLKGAEDEKALRLSS